MKKKGQTHRPSVHRSPPSGTGDSVKNRVADFNNEKPGGSKAQEEARVMGGTNL